MGIPRWFSMYAAMYSWVLKNLVAVQISLRMASSNCNVELALASEIDPVTSPVQSSPVRRLETPKYCTGNQIPLLLASLLSVTAHIATRGQHQLQNEQSLERVMSLRMASYLFFCKC